MNDQYDSVLISILQNEGGLEKYLDVMFGFLMRRTDFFYEREKGKDIGLPPDVAKKMLLRSFNKYQTFFRRYQDEHLRTTGDPGAKHPTGDQQATPTEGTVVGAATPAAAKGDSKPKAPRPKKELVGPGCTFKKDEKGERFYEAEPDCYNGARRDLYSWSQQILEIDIRVKIPENIKSGRELTVRLERKHVYVSEKDAANPIIDLDLFRDVKTAGATWSFEPDESVVAISLDKIDDYWWESAFEGEEKINVQNIDCSRPMNDLDDETQAKIAQMMFDQEQKRKGLPTSEEKKIEGILAGAWNKEGSPFQGQPFDPSKLSLGGGGAGGGAGEGPPFQPPPQLDLD